MGNTVVQSSYAPQIRAGVPGQISHETSWDASTWLCGTAAGIGFGVAVSSSAGNPKTAVIGGTLLGFLGITCIDISQDGLPISPLSGVEVAHDLYPQYSNMGVLTRGRIWVIAQADVAAGDPLFFEAAGGTLGNSASGTEASGAVTFTQMPQPLDTIAINGTAVTWEAATATGEEEVVGASLGASLVALAAFLNANVAADAQVAKFEFDAEPASPEGGGEGFGANVLHYAARTPGVAGNALVVSTTTAGATVTAMAGGTAAALAVSGATWLDNAVAGDIARVSLRNQV